MISVCTTTYRETDQLEVFLRCLLGNASDRRQLEVIVTNDEDWGPTNEVLSRMQKLYPRIGVIHHTKEQRVKKIQQSIDFYREKEIFPSDDIDVMQQVLQDYKDSKDASLWYPCSLGYNLAAKDARGDYLVFLPSDYVCGFDIVGLCHYIRDKVVSRRGAYFGCFDWFDMTSLEPMPDFLGDLRNGNSYILTRKWFVQAQTQPVTMVHQQHGAKIVTADSYKFFGKGFDDRWFTRAIGDDIMNFQMQHFTDSSEWRIRNIPGIEDYFPYVGNQRRVLSEIHYLCTNYTLANHTEYIDKVKAYLAKEKA